MLKGKLYYDIGRDVIKYNEELALDCEIKAREIFKKLKIDSLYYRVTCSMIYPHIHNGRYDEAEPLIDEGLAYWLKVKNKKWTASAYSKIAYLEVSRGDYVKSLDYLLKCYEMEHTFKTTNQMGDTYMDMVNLYSKIGDCESALNYCQNYLNYPSETSQDKQYKLILMQNIVPCLERMGMHKLIKEYNELSKNRFKNKKSFHSVSRHYSSKYKSEFVNGNFDKAKIYLDSAYHFAVAFGNKKRLADVNEQLFKFYSATDQKKHVVRELEEFLSNAIESNYLEAEQRANEYLSTFYTEQKQYRRALIYDKKSDSLKNKLLSNDAVQALRKLDYRLHKERTDEEIKNLEAQNQLKAINLKNEKKIKLFLLGLLLGSILLLTLIYFLYKQRANSNKELKEKNNTISKALKTNKMLMKEIHHRVKNNLQVVSSLLFLQSRFVEDESAKGAIQTGRSRVQAMSILHQKLYQKEDLQSVKIKSYFEDLSSNLFNTYHIHNQNILFNSDVQDIELDVDIVIPMGLITNELISNALKHAFDLDDEGYINLTVIESKNKIILKVEDNGKGLPFEKFPDQTDSLGIDLIKSFAEKLDAEIIIDNTNGASVTIVFDSRLKLN